MESVASLNAVKHEALSRMDSVKAESASKVDYLSEELHLEKTQVAKMTCLGTENVTTHGFPHAACAY